MANQKTTPEMLEGLLTNNVVLPEHFYESQYSEQPCVSLTIPQLIRGAERYHSVGAFVSALNTTKTRLDSCGTVTGELHCPTHENGESHYKRLMKKNCRIKLCAKGCNNIRRSLRIRETLKEVRSWGNALDVTLTIKGHHDLDVRNIRRYNKWTTLLFNHPQIKSRWKGWIVNLEIVESEDGFYFHFHCLIKGYPIDIRKVSRIWSKITRGTYRVSISQIKKSKWQTQKAVEYALKGSKTVLQNQLPREGDSAAAHSVKYTMKASPSMPLVEYVIGMRNTKTFRASTQFLFLLVRQGHNSSMICPICGSELVKSFDDCETFREHPPPDTRLNRIPLKISVSLSYAIANPSEINGYYWPDNTKSSLVPFVSGSAVARAGSLSLSDAGKPPVAEASLSQGVRSHTLLLC